MAKQRIERCFGGTRPEINRLLGLAIRLENLGSSPQSAIRERIEAEFARLARAGLFSLSSTTGA